MTDTPMRVNKHYTLGVKESMPLFAFSYLGFCHSGREPPNKTKQKIPKLSRRTKFSTRPLASWRLTIPIQDCATFRVAGKTISFVGMKGWVSLEFSRVGLFMQAENLALKVLVAL